MKRGDVAIEGGSPSETRGNSNLFCSGSWFLAETRRTAGEEGMRYKDGITNLTPAISVPSELFKTQQNLNSVVKRAKKSPFEYPVT